MKILHNIQRGLLAVTAAWLGAFSLAALLVPKYVASKGLGVAANATVGAFAQLGAGARLSLALIAMIAAFTPKPPRTLVSAIALGLLFGVGGVTFCRLLSIYSPAEAKPFATWLWIDGILGASLAITETVRYVRRNK
jgi:hypothetical protein